MIRRPKIGMKVRILQHTGIKEYNGDEQVLSFDSTRGDTGVIEDIESLVALAHQSKLYHIRLDEPNWGVWKVMGTQFIEEVK